MIGRMVAGRWSVAGVLGLVLILIGLPVRGAEIRVVDAERAELRQGPGPKAPTVGSVSRGSWVACANRPVEGYFKIRLARGKVGWVKADAVVPPLQGFVEDSQTPLLAGGHASAATLKRLAGGTMLLVLPTAVNGFYAVRADTGETGWISEKKVFLGYSAQVVGPDFDVRPRPSRAGKPSFSLSNGDWVYSNRVESGQLVKVRTEDGRTGWMNPASLRFGDRPKDAPPPPMSEGGEGVPNVADEAE